MTNLLNAKWALMDDTWTHWSGKSGYAATGEWLPEGFYRFKDGDVQFHSGCQDFEPVLAEEPVAPTPRPTWDGLAWPPTLGSLVYKEDRGFCDRVGVVVAHTQHPGEKFKRAVVQFVNDPEIVGPSARSTSIQPAGPMLARDRFLRRLKTELRNDTFDKLSGPKKDDLAMALHDFLTTNLGVELQ